MASKHLTGDQREPSKCLRARPSGIGRARESASQNPLSYADQPLRRLMTVFLG